MISIDLPNEKLVIPPDFVQVGENRYAILPAPIRKMTTGRKALHILSCWTYAIWVGVLFVSPLYAWSGFPAWLKPYSENYWNGLMVVSGILVLGMLRGFVKSVKAQHSARTNSTSGERPKTSVSWGYHERGYLDFVGGMLTFSGPNFSFAINPKDLTEPRIENRVFLYFKVKNSPHIKTLEIYGGDPIGPRGLDLKDLLHEISDQPVHDQPSVFPPRILSGRIRIRRADRIMLLQIIFSLCLPFITLAALLPPGLEGRTNQILGWTVVIVLSLFLAYVIFEAVHVRHLRKKARALGIPEKFLYAADE